MAQEIQSREWEKMNKRTIRAWVNSSARRLSCDTLHSECICRLTLPCISSEISTKLLGMPTHPDWPSLTASGPYLMPTGHFCCPVSTANCPSPSPVAKLTSLSSFFPTPLPTSGHVEDRGLRPKMHFYQELTVKIRDTATRGIQP